MYPQYTPKDVLRFWSKVALTANPEKCWNWTAGHNPRGYGVFWLNQKLHLATHISWIITNGEIPSDLWILHHCDNPACVNPQHLFLGTHLDNTVDKLTKNRQQRGEQTYNHKLTREKAKLIRQIYARGGVTMRDLADLMQISLSQVSEIVNGNSWRD